MAHAHEVNGEVIFDNGDPERPEYDRTDETWRDAIRNASTLADLKAVLAGDADVAQAERRPVR